MNVLNQKKSNIYVYPSMKPFSGFTTLLHHPNNPRCISEYFFISNIKFNIY